MQFIINYLCFALFCEDDVFLLITLQLVVAAAVLQSGFTWTGAMRALERYSTKFTSYYVMEVTWQGASHLLDALIHTEHISPIRSNPHILFFVCCCWRYLYIRATTMANVQEEVQAEWSDKTALQEHHTAPTWLQGGSSAACRISVLWAHYPSGGECSSFPFACFRIVSLFFFFLHQFQWGQCCWCRGACKRWQKR